MTISAKIIADSVSPQGVRLTTLQLRYPKFIHGEFMTHRVFSRNASSSRAIPVERLIKDVIDDPVYPMHWGKNQPGMQAYEECDSSVEIYSQDYVLPGTFPRDKAWDHARESAITMAQAFVKAGYHKQIVNRLLEPFCHINVVVTATEWSNFFALRCHPGAQPEMRVLAEKIRGVMSASRPRSLEPGDWHTPYLSEEECTAGPFNQLHKEAVKDNDVVNEENYWKVLCQLAIRVSVARCARVSYLTQEGKKPTIEEDLKLYDHLVGAVPLHASPAEHQATPDTQISINDPNHVGLVKSWKQPHLHGNLRGWVQYRKKLMGENQ